RRQCSPSHAAHPRWLERGEGPICFVGALDSRLNVQQVRLAGCLRAPPRSWTLLIALAGLLHPAPRGWPTWCARRYCAQGPICFADALDSRLNVARSRSPGLPYPLASPPAAARPSTVRLAGCLRAPPRIWTLLIALAGFLPTGS